MRRRYLLLGLLVPVLGACSSATKAGTSSTPAVTTEVPAPATASTPAASSPSASSAVGQNTVGIADFKFTPPDVKVPVGGSVVWTNNDNQAHTATSAGAFDAGAIQPGASATVMFQTAGTFTYICSFHPFMTGTVTVG
ncbi:MAG: hypothetical protein QOE09_1485 [Ilumatobacteraceae bacterium]|jgi:plastocyanin